MGELFEERAVSLGATPKAEALLGEPTCGRAELGLLRSSGQDPFDSTRQLFNVASSRKIAVDLMPDHVRDPSGSKRRDWSAACSCLDDDVRQIVLQEGRNEYICRRVYFCQCCFVVHFAKMMRREACVPRIIVIALAAKYDEMYVGPVARRPESRDRLLQLEIALAAILSGPQCTEEYDACVRGQSKFLPHPQSITRTEHGEIDPGWDALYPPIAEQR